MTIRPLFFLLASLLGFAASGQVDMSVPQVANSPKWFATGIMQSWSAIPSVAGFQVTTNSYQFTLIDQTNLLGVHSALVSYAGKTERYRGLSNGGWEGPDYSPPTGQRISFCCGSFEFFAATNPPEAQRFFQCGRPAYGMTPINESTDLVNWLLFKFAPLTNPPALTCRVKTVKMPWPVN